MEYHFTLHAKQRMRERGISLEDVLQTIEYAERTKKCGTKYYLQKNIRRRTLEVVYESRGSFINIITAYWV